MKALDREALTEFANQEIVHFHAARLARLEKLSLKRVLQKEENRYLFGAKSFIMGWRQLPLAIPAANERGSYRAMASW